jgi:dTDP-4-dehydrorhamnose reductase
VVSDQVGAPTSAELIADVTAIAVNRVLTDPLVAGVYHLTAGGQTSWHGFATFLIEQAAKMGLPMRVDRSAIHAIGAKDFPTQAARPANSAMSNAKLEALLNITMPDWEVHASRFVEQIARIKGLGKA